MKRPRLALPYSILAEADAVRLVAGEDFRYTLAASGLGAWLPALLRELDGVKTLDEVLARVPDDKRAAARGVVERLAGERVLVEGEPRLEPMAYGLAVSGSGPLGEALRAGAKASASGAVVSVLVQDRLDFESALAWSDERRRGASPFLWATTAPLTRAYVSPVFLPEDGPCLRCLVRHFERLSPAPEIHAALREHSRRGGELAAAPFADEGVAILAALVRWKAALLARDERPSAVFELHVLEVASLEVSAHRVLVDPEHGAHAR